MKKVKRSKRHMTRGDIQMVSEEVNPNMAKMKDEDVKQASDRADRNNKLRSDSGNIDFEDTLTSFFYVLLRNHLPAGTVEKLVRDVVCEPNIISYSNGFLAQYANNLAVFLKESKTNTLAKNLERAFENKPKAYRLLDDAAKMNNISNLGSDTEELKKLKEKVNKAINDMTDEEKKEYNDRMSCVEKEEQALLVIQNKIRDDMVKETNRLKIEGVESFVINRLNPEARNEWLKSNITEVKDNEEITDKEALYKLEEAANKFIKEESVSLGTVDAEDNTMVEAAKKGKFNIEDSAAKKPNKGTWDRPQNTDDNNETRQEWLRENIDDASKWKKWSDKQDEERKLRHDARDKWIKSNAKSSKSLNNHKKLQYKSDLIGSLDALDNLKKLVPSDSVEQIVDILKSEIKSELTDDAKEEIETRESILEKRAQENAEHKSPEPDAEEKAVEFIKDKVAEQVAEKVMEETVNENEKPSRGKLKDVSEGRAFPEALDKVFDEEEKVLDGRTAVKVNDSTMVIVKGDKVEETINLLEKPVEPTTNEEALEAMKGLVELDKKLKGEDK